MVKLNFIAFRVSSLVEKKIFFFFFIGKINERLLCLEAASDASGKGMFDTFCAISEKYQINWKEKLCAQAYDGAASMQGVYSGLKTFIQKENPRAVYIWCFAHILNLAIVDTLDSSTDTRNFFGDLQGLIGFMRARKRTAIFYECQKKLNVGTKAKDRIKKLKTFSDTRWTSHDRVILVIHDKFDALKEALKILSDATDRVTSSNARIFLTTISSFNFVLIMKLMKQLFAITTPLSCYLQSKSIDFIQAYQLVDMAKKELEKMRSTEKFQELVEDTKLFATENNIDECDFKEIRIRKRKIFDGEQTSDEQFDSVSER